MPTPTPDQGSGGAEGRVLWCAHVRGPDDVHAVASYDDAVKLCDSINARFWRNPKDDENDPTIIAYPALWPWSAALHAAEIQREPV